MSMSAGSKLVNIRIVSDVMCPWCWVGKRKLEEAIRDLEGKYSFNVRWEPFLLKPDSPPEGIPKPRQDENDPGRRHLTSAGEAVGIKFTYLCPVYPNTVLAHVLLDYAAGQGDGLKQDDVAERLFKAYFTDGKSLAKKDVLEVAQAAGFDTSEVQTVLEDTKVADSIRKKAQSWSGQGIHGVPYFIINGKPAFSGAQDKEAFKAMIKKLAP